MLWQLEAWRALCRRGNGFKGLLGLDICNSLDSGERQGMLAWLLQGWKERGLPWWSWKSYSSLRLVSTAGTSSVYCDKTGRGSSNSICKIFGDICNHVEGTILFWSRALTPLSDNTESSFCLPSKSVYAEPKFTKHHGTKSPLPFRQLGPKVIFKAPLPQPLHHRLLTFDILAQWVIPVYLVISYLISKVVLFLGGQWRFEEESQDQQQQPGSQAEPG